MVPPLAPLASREMGLDQPFAIKQRGEMGGVNERCAIKNLPSHICGAMKFEGSEDSFQNQTKDKKTDDFST